MAISLAIIIVNWNSGELLRRCIESIVDARSPDIDLRRVVIVDNASTDGSADGLADIALPLDIQRSPSNRGFAAACNQGARQIDAEYLLFLNPDAALRHDSLSAPLAFMARAENAEVGICGIQLTNDSGDVARTCSRLPTLSTFLFHALGLNRLAPRCFPSQSMREWDHLSTRSVDQIMGAFFLVRTALFNTLGGFDERFFVYWEEVDFSLRAQQYGKRSVYLAEAQAYHKGGGTSEKIKARRLFYSLRSRIRYGYKNLGALRGSILVFITLFIEPISRLVLAGILNRSKTQMSETIEGYAMLWRDIFRRFRSSASS